MPVAKPIQTPRCVELAVAMQPQPTETSCGPACLQAIYHYWQDPVDFDRLNATIHSLDAGGTLDVFLANHALERGYRARIHTLNLRLFDPSWFSDGKHGSLGRKLADQAASHPEDDKLQVATHGYQRFLELGGELVYGEINSAMVKRYLRRGVPVLTGLSATYLYACARENPISCEADPIAGRPVGHFVVLSGYKQEQREILVADPYAEHSIPGSEGKHLYAVNQDRLIGAVFLGVLTWDANLLVIEPGRKANKKQAQR